MKINEREREKGKILPPEPKGPFPKLGLILADPVFKLWEKEGTI